MLVEVGLEELGLAPLEVRQVQEAGLDQGASHDLGKVLGTGGLLHLLEARLLLEALGLEARQGRAELRELLVEEGPSLLDVDDPLLLADLLEGHLGGLDLLALVVDLASEPLPRLGRGLVAQLQGLLDVELAIAGWPCAQPARAGRPRR